MYNNIKLFQDRPEEQGGFEACEVVQLTSIALLKIIRHSQMGIPIEVMGIMLGKFIDNTTIEISDIFAMPQTGTKVSVEAVDPVFQTKMLELLSQLEKYEIIVGWYHSHPGFGCWLSAVDINTQKSFEQLNQRSVALVIDPIQSTKGNIIIEIFRLHSSLSINEESPEITSLEYGIKTPPNLKEEPSYNKSYYNLNISFRKNLIEEISLSTIFEKAWNINFFSSIWSGFSKKNSIKTILKILKNLKKGLIGPKNFENKWSRKNILKLKKIKKETKDFLEILSQEAISFCLSQILKEGLIGKK
ncbi:prsS13 (nucleomorph) [Hemiselmis andersenii]|uniref:COP9 signalosome complex subunit 5 n=1 Tax=Hemiselmis andersenii TaxID=464988 RepID=A9BKP5_HEMAN|nr:prsS13 [Hemiselmis andersenii]ABW98050.1 prsS13 [Hemiselmis andersenii]|mmetsp:Transcript_23512/g.54673  ORF Transcript_23512/g.54673 Transcript_23512/m.54673 type:complete len:302 (-) Transcript_23512:4385-5290(-)